MDFAIATLTETQSMSWSDVDEDEFALAGITLKLPGLIAEQDFQYVLDKVGVGGWAVVLVEHTWSFPKSQYQRAGATLIPITTIPNEIAEAVLELVSKESFS